MLFSHLTFGGPKVSWGCGHAWHGCCAMARVLPGATAAWPELGSHLPPPSMQWGQGWCHGYWHGRGCGYCCSTAGAGVPPAPTRAAGLARTSVAEAAAMGVSHLPLPGVQRVQDGAACMAGSRAATAAGALPAVLSCPGPRHLTHPINL